MPSRTDRTSGEIDWVDGLERTLARERERTSKFSVTFHDALLEIAIELEDRVGADDWRVSTAAPHRKSDGRPHADATPDDPAVVIRWSKDGQQYAVAADHYADWRDNCRAIGLYIREKRKMSNRPVTTGQDEFATARLPSGDDAVVAGPGDRSAHEVLGVDPDADPETVRAAYREQIKESHPDGGGTSAEARELNEAKEAMLNGQ